MKNSYSRRSVLGVLGAAVTGLLASPVARTAKAAVQEALAATGAAKGYDPTKHKWVMGIDVNTCIGCGLCAEACKRENHVPEGPFYRTWIERYTIAKPDPGSGKSRGKTTVESPMGGMNGFGQPQLSKDEILHSFFVPKLCTLCEHSPCVQVCP